MDLFKEKLFNLAYDISPLPGPRSPGEQQAVLRNVLSIVFVIVGAVALLYITIAGFRYVISHGDPRVIAQSKNAILYALVGLVVAASAFAIVNFVLGNV